MIDGGIWANNPVMNAVVDALACFDVPRENLRILSIGTGTSTFTVDADAQKGGVKQWAFMRSFNAAARAQSKNALGQTFLLVGKPNVVRIDPPETDRPHEMKIGGRDLRERHKRAKSLAEGTSNHIKVLFSNDPATAFAPCPKR